MNLPFSTTLLSSSFLIAAAPRPARGLDASIPVTDRHGRIVAAASTNRPAPLPMSTSDCAQNTRAVSLIARTKM
jgi:hypothetical protein